MNKSMMTGIVLGAITATAGGTFAGYKLLANSAPDYADVINVEELKSTTVVPREVCEDVVVTRQRPAQDEQRVAGTLAGAVIGGVLGNQLGGGSGKKLATVAGAVAGGYTGNRVQQNMQAGDTYTTTENKCRTVGETREQVSGYLVSYRAGDKEGTVRMNQRPGDRIPLENGMPVLDSPAPADAATGE